MPMDGDIFIAQRAVSDSEKKSSTIRYPDVASYLAYIRNRCVFRTRSSYLSSWTGACLNSFSRHYLSLS